MRYSTFIRLVLQAWSAPFPGLRAAVSFSGMALALLALARMQSSYDAAIRLALLLPPLLMLPLSTVVFAWDRQSGLDRVLGSVPVGYGALVASRACAAVLWALLMLAAAAPAQILLSMTFGPMVWRELPSHLVDAAAIAATCVLLGCLVGLAFRARPMVATSLSFGWTGFALILSIAAEEGTPTASLLRVTPLHVASADGGMAPALTCLGLLILVVLIARLADRASDAGGWTTGSARILAPCLILMGAAAIAILPLPAMAEDATPSPTAIVPAEPSLVMAEKDGEHSIRLTGRHEGSVRLTDERGRTIGQGQVTPSDEGSVARFIVDSAPATTQRPARLLLLENGTALRVDAEIRVAGKPAHGGSAALVGAISALPAALSLGVGRIPNARQRQA